ncbi:MAG: carboxylesterase family protein [Chloroflexota bacterium]
MSNPTVVIKSGRVEGIQQENVSVFKSIPYAKAPVGDLRWRPPQPVGPWTGTFKADKFGPMAMQRGAEMMEFLNNLMAGQGMGKLKIWFFKNMIKYGPRPAQSEDSLHLTVRSPNLDNSAKLPVMVWIHGGAHQDGSSVEPFYDGNALPERGVVTVTINYRLGLLGFMSHPELSAESEHGVSGNYGMLDQIAALEWVQQNIEQFGGDPDNVTIFGESAGGESVLHLMCSPLARGLFHKAIPQSAATGAQYVHLKKPFGTFPSAEAQGEAFMTRAGAKSISDLRKMSAQELQKVVQAGHFEEGNFYPVIDGWSLPKSIPQTFIDGDQANVPLLIGTNGDESTLFASIMESPLMEYAQVPNPTSGLPDYMQAEFGDDLNRVVELYPGLENCEPKAAVDLQGDTFFGAPTRLYAGEHSQNAPTYLYHFRRTSPLPGQTGGAFHAGELAFVHGTSSPIVHFTEADQPLADTMQTYWTNFAKTSDPNGSSLPQWSTFDDSNPSWMTFNTGDVRERPIELEEQYQIFMRRIGRKLDMMRELESPTEAIPAD